LYFALVRAYSFIITILRGFPMANTTLSSPSTGSGRAALFSRVSVRFRVGLLLGLGVLALAFFLTVTMIGQKNQDTSRQQVSEWNLVQAATR
jgi:Na+-driven multidrug efflux pump